MPAPGPYLLDKNDLQNPTHVLTYTLHRSPRRCSLALRVDRDGAVHVHAPAGMHAVAVRVFVARHADWIAQRQNECRLAAERRRACLRDGGSIPVLDGQLILRLTLADRAAASVQTGSKYIYVYAKSAANVPLLLEAWYRSQARDYVERKIRESAPRIGRRPRRIQIRGQKSRWGSCSSRGTISINWRLMQIPSRFVDYVIAHELCHLVHPDHSPRFWREVARLEPEYTTIRSELRSIAKRFLL